MNDNSLPNFEHATAAVNGVKIHYVRGGTIKNCRHFIAQERLGLLAAKIKNFLDEHK